jgi:hypothetical protein
MARIMARIYDIVDRRCLDSMISTDDLYNQ